MGGEVTDIDCSEYPCIVFGAVRDDDKAAFKLSGTDALADYTGDMQAMSVWGGQTVIDGKPRKQVTFGVPVLPDGSVDSDDLQRRLKLRYQAYWDAAKASEADDK